MRRQIEQYVSYTTFQLAVFENFHNITMKYKIKGNQLRGISRLCKGKKDLQTQGLYTDYTIKTDSVKAFQF